MKVKTQIQIAASAMIVAAALFSTSCSTKPTAQKDTSSVLQISVPAQELVLYKEGKVVNTYPVSTSKYGLGNEKGSFRTPLGRMEVAEKIGGGKPAGAVFKSRKWTGEVVKPNSPGRDPIVSRILWLRGTERKNDNTYSRCIYIHGTAAEKDIGKPVSYGCVRMKSTDVIDLYRKVGEGATVYITKKDLSKEVPEPQIGNSGPDGLEMEALPLEPSPQKLNGTPALVRTASTPAVSGPAPAPAPAVHTASSAAAPPLAQTTPTAELNRPAAHFQPGAAARIGTHKPECDDPNSVPIRIPPAEAMEAPMKRDFLPFRMSSN